MMTVDMEVEEVEGVVTLVAETGTGEVEGDMGVVEEKTEAVAV